ncbi:MAG: flavin reductase family protein [Polynucleobacter sp.]|jgi:flavin reductase (DIM6/NTAB) family NADH-FMN oxidoreductase RutF|nr:flavin reductase family protein [Polynucleobacter sp.]
MISGKLLRNAFGSFPTGVTVITSLTKNEAKPFGITISSFNTVSLEPPLILWSLGKHSSYLNDLGVGSHHLIHVLHEDQAELAIRFSKTNPNPFTNLAYTSDEFGFPCIANCLAYFLCQVDSIYPGGDHQIIVAKITQLSDPKQGKPLIFSNSQFASLK